jgi:hypothetical protein
MNTLISVAFIYFTEALLYSLYMFCLYDVRGHRRVQIVILNTMIMSFACEVLKYNDLGRLFMPIFLFVLVMSFSVPSRSVFDIVMVAVYTMVYSMGLFVTEAIAASVLYFVISSDIRSLDIKQYVMVCMTIKAMQFFVLILMAKGGAINEMVNWQNKRAVFKRYKQGSGKDGKGIQ